jgi:hypothetical protein
LKQLLARKSLRLAAQGVNGAYIDAKGRRAIKNGLTYRENSAGKTTIAA